MVPGGDTLGFGPACRLRKTDDFARVFDGSDRFVGRYFVMLSRPGGSASTRMGVVASKRTFRRAVDRARAKRLLRESFRLLRPGLHTGFDIILIARHAILKVRRPAVDAELAMAAARRCLLAKEQDR